MIEIMPVVIGTLGSVTKGFDRYINRLFVSGFRLKLMYASLIESIKSSLTHLHGFQQLVWLP